MDIIITGASRGIGKELCLLLASDNKNRIIACARSKAKLDELHEAAGNNKNLQILVVDLGAADEIQSLAEKVKKTGFKPGILINNAGLLVNKPFQQLTSDDFDRSFNINLKAPFLLIQALLPHFAENAHIVNIGSMGGYQGSAKFPGLSLYSAAKGALAIFTECLAEELKDKGIKANCLALGAAQTEMLAEAFPGYKAPLTAQEMASFIADFALNGHRFFNGKVLPVSVSTP
jgi:NAD(P)-dependent dehydrogenase (short-subunit alcohol dehydrogenase family)